MTILIKTIDKIERENLMKKVDSLCKKYHCSMFDLLIMSIDKQAEIKKAQQNKII